MDHMIRISGEPPADVSTWRPMPDGGVTDDAGHVYYKRHEDYESAVIAKCSPKGAEYLREMWGVK